MANSGRICQFRLRRRQIRTLLPEHAYRLPSRQGHCDSALERHSLTRAMAWNTWRPTRVLRHERALGTSMNTAVVLTDAGRGYLKALGNAQGEHALACELIGSSLADWLGLPGLDYGLVTIDADDEVCLDDDEQKPLHARRRASAGPAFITKALETARTWSGDPQILARLKNIDTLTGLVVVDTWIGNPDRHPRRPPDASISTWQHRNLDNVMLHRPPGARKDRVLAMDFSVCLHCRAGGLRPSYGDGLVRDDGIYGLYPEFEPYVTVQRAAPFLDRLRQASELAQHLVEVMARIPSEWQVDARTRSGVREFLSARAAYLVDNFRSNLQRVLPPAADQSVSCSPLLPRRP